MNRLVCLGLLSLTACAGPASVRVPPAPSITPGALPTVQVRPDAAKPKSSQSITPVDLWDTSHLQVGEGILLEELSLTESVSVVGNPKARAVAVAASRITAKAEEAQGGDAADAAEGDAPAEEKKGD